MSDVAGDDPPAPTDALRVAWEGATAAWDNQKAHDAVVSAAAAAGSYAWAAGRYRKILRERPDDAVATRQLDRISKAAAATLFASATVRPDRTPGPYRATMTVLAVFIIAIVASLVYAAFSSKSGGDDDGSGGDGAGTVTPARPAAPGVR